MSTIVSGIERIHLKCDCIGGSVVNGNTLPILYILAFDKPRGYTVVERLRNKRYKKIIKSNLSKISFFL